MGLREERAFQAEGQSRGKGHVAGVCPRCGRKARRPVYISRTHGGRAVGQETWELDGLGPLGLGSIFTWDASFGSQHTRWSDVIVLCDSSSSYPFYK